MKITIVYNNNQTLTDSLIEYFKIKDYNRV